MEKATAKAKAMGKNLLLRAMGGSNNSGDEAEHGVGRKPSWSEVVSSPPLQNRRPEAVRRAGMPLMTNSSGGTHPQEAGMPTQVGGGSGPREGAGRREEPRQWSGKTLSAAGEGGKPRASPQRLFSADEVAKLVEIARNQLKKERAAGSGWIEVETQEGKRKEKAYARELVDDYCSDNGSSPEKEVRCWQCDKLGHLSSACPKGERCFTCNRLGHKRAFCPLKYRSRAEKGKGTVYMGEPVRKNVAVRMVDRREEQINEKVVDLTESHGHGKEAAGERLKNDRGVGVLSGKMGERITSIPTSSVNLKEKQVYEHCEKENKSFERTRRRAPVYLIKATRAAEERAALLEARGVVTKANGNPSVKDLIEALKNLCSSYSK